MLPYGPLPSLYFTYICPPFLYSHRMWKTTMNTDGHLSFRRSTPSFSWNLGYLEPPGLFSERALGTPDLVSKVLCCSLLLDSHPGLGFSDSQWTMTNPQTRTSGGIEVAHLVQHLCWLRSDWLSRTVLVDWSGSRQVLQQFTTNYLRITTFRPKVCGFLKEMSRTLYLNLTQRSGAASQHDQESAVDLFPKMVASLFRDTSHLLGLTTWFGWMDRSNR